MPRSGLRSGSSRPQATAGASFIDAALQDHYREWDLASLGLGHEWTTVFITPQFTTSRHVVALVYAPGARQPALVVKVPRCPGDNEGVQREADMLRQLRALSGGQVEGVPRIVATLEAGAYTVLVETPLTGPPLDPDRVAANLPAAVALGVDFVDSLPCTLPGSTNEGWYERTVEHPLEALAALLSGDAEIVELVHRTHKLLEPLRSEALPAVFEHADLSHPNLLVRPGGGLQVMDWERASAYGIPGHDLTFYLQYLSESSEQAFERPAQLAAFDSAFGPDGWALAPLRRHLLLRDVHPELLPQVVLATWARSASTLAYRLAAEVGPAAGMGDVRQAVLNDRDFWLWRHAAAELH
ncbi:phosphotransferase family protein [Arthrobacter sp. B3I4]|uniref:phosphotransferase family protein n=1 Tax=Arthrobacter sp. B3I4 TaxID=3042267 RepID=UPI0027D7BE09|nr:aminoglycoside phosphotransferase family protein [Arthrobacter sp. B3I4]